MDSRHPAEFFSGNLAFQHHPLRHNVRIYDSSATIGGLEEDHVAKGEVEKETGSKKTKSRGEETGRHTGAATAVGRG
jgi:hypothetical protein